MSEFCSIHEECGVAGVFSNDEAVGITRTCLRHLQHRGQEGCGVAVCREDGTIGCIKGLGLVSDVFGPTDTHDDAFCGRSAIGHVRYGTSGGRILENVQPFVLGQNFGSFSIAHNGNIVNADRIKESLSIDGDVFSSTSDSEIIAHLIHKYRMTEARSMQEAIVLAMNRIDGAVSLLVLTNDTLYACRDKYGFRPLSFGRLDEGYAFASESCALEALGATDIRQIEPGELVTVNSAGMDITRHTECLSTSKMCAMEYIYFARPDSVIDDICVHTFRKNSGRILFEESPADADMVVAVPDSGISAAIGYAEAGGLPFEMGLIKNAYVGRTFIQPSQQMREVGVKMKLSPLASVIRGKRLVLIDDSIVRGTTSRNIIRMLREAGAAGIHMRITSPMITSPCFYGVDISSSKELICAGRTLGEVCAAIEADSLAFISEQGLLRAGSRDDMCLACFNGKYPTDIYNHQL